MHWKTRNLTAFLTRELNDFHEINPEASWDRDVNTITFANRISWPCQIAFNLCGLESKPLERAASIRRVYSIRFDHLGSSFDVACNGVLRRSKERRENFALCGEERGKIGRGKITGVREQVSLRGPLAQLFCSFEFPNLSLTSCRVISLKARRKFRQEGNSN